MNTHLLRRFFAPLEPVVFDGEIMDYEKLKYVTQLLNQMSDILPHNSYIIDYYQKNFLFISKHSIFLCGYTEMEAMEMGYDFYTKILTPENLEKLIEINNAGFKFFYDLPFQKRTDSSIAYDLVLRQKDGSSFCINHKLKPFLFTKEENIWLSICCIRPSANNSTGNVRCFFKETNERYSYSFKNKRWQKLSPIILSEIEKFIVIETDKGTLEKQQAAQLGCTRSNIRYYKNLILKKTETTSMREAILFLYSNCIL